jgi:GTP pyrophosphokinase
MDEKRLSFAQVNDIYGFRIIVPDVITATPRWACCTSCTSRCRAASRTTSPSPRPTATSRCTPRWSGPPVSVEFQIRTEEMHIVAEAGVAAHWLYKAASTASCTTPSWAPVAAVAAGHPERDARRRRVLGHVKVDLFPTRSTCSRPRQILALPRGATVVDFAYAIHSNVGDHTVAAKVNGEQVPLRTELKNGDVEIITAPVPRPTRPGWASCAPGARAPRSAPPQDAGAGPVAHAGRKLLAQALRAEGLGQPPGDGPEDKPIWDKLLRFTGNRARRTAADIGLGKRSASMVAKRLVTLLGEQGVKPDALLLTRARYTAHENLSQGAVTVDGSADASITYATCCRPIPGDGYLGRGEGLVVHTDDCAWRAACSTRTRALHHRGLGRRAGARLRGRHRRHRGQRQGRAGAVAAAIASAESDIVHLGMPDEVAQDALDLRFVITVRDRTHLDHVLRTCAGRTRCCAPRARFRPPPERRLSAV